MIRCVSVELILPLRHEILRAGLPFDTAKFDGDLDPLTTHFGAFDDNILLGCVTIMPRDWDNAPAWQLRGMAVRSNLQRSGVGRRLLVAAEEHIRASTHSKLAWCNARVPASGFYQKLGWQIVSDVFDIPTAGPHVKMIKRMM